MIAKSELRKEFLSKRKSLSSAYIEEHSKSITQKILELIRQKDFLSFHIYTECRDGEVDTQYILEGLGRFEVSISTYSFDSKDFNTKVIQGNKTEVFDCIIVPGIVFDTSGYRIGYGAGIYDRFLSKHPQAFTIGIAYDWQIIPQIPIENHDIPVKLLITDNFS